jgi:hypothetical protein
MFRVSYFLMGVRKTTFFRALVTVTELAPYLDSWVCPRWLAGQRTPMVFLSSDTQTTRPVASHSGHFIMSPTLTMNCMGACLPEYSGIFSRAEAPILKVFICFPRFVKRISDS